MRISDNIRGQRLDRVGQLLQRHPDGLRETEIARLLNFGRRTTNNYLRELEMQGRAYREEQLWFPLPHQNMVLRRLDLQPEEAMTLYLSLRLFVKQSDQRNEAAETTLVRLAQILKDDMGLGEDIIAAAQELAQRPTTPGYESIFRTVMRGYIYRRKIEIMYHPYRGEPFKTVLSSYLLEPSAIGFATYVIGHSSVVNTLRTFKLERIVQAQLLLHEEYTIPSDFPGLALLRTAWSIYHGERLREVILRFEPAVARRVRETNWHPSQILTDDPQQPGYLIMKLQVPDFTDLIPWIRSWGSACEVVEPAELRRTISKEIQHMAAVYAIETVRPETPLAALWAKADRKTGEIHLLIHHLIDVAQVALALWTSALNVSIRRQVSVWLNTDEDSAGRLIALWVGLHDIGKACPAFQRKHPPAEPLLSRVGLTIPANAAPSVPHGKVTAKVLPILLGEQTGESPERKGTLAHKIACALGGHHGTWPSPQELLSVTDFTETVLGDRAWENAREDLWNALKGVFIPPNDVHIKLDQSSLNSLLVLLSGLTSVADWIGSMEEFFPYDDQLDDLSAYAAKSAEQAHEALHRLGWSGWSSTGDFRSFSELFPDIPSVNSIQQAVIDAASGRELPALAILEAPTGVGKTEAALCLADNWLQRGFGRGLYVAMPTQATSNQMFDRVLKFLERRFPRDLVNVHLLHGQARWTERARQIQVHHIADDEQHTIAAMSWFLPRKRSLLAPFAVGTVDQVLMSVLLTRHFFVRLFGVSHKVIIFDEVHAYDIYMSVLFHRLLAWLRQLGASVVILSATLPEHTRRELLKSYAGEQPQLEYESDAYPRLTLCDPSGTRTFALPVPQSRVISVEWIPRLPGEIARYLAQELRNGGCAVVVCNTVARAQDVFRAVQEAGIVLPDELTLFHARFPSLWRQEIEEQVLGAFGKNGDRPPRSILIATQVVEQSLDLDFDLMITDPAPIDLILQRAGRLHRHPGNERPSNLETPRLVVTAPDMNGLVPTFGSDKYVYEEYILLTSTLLLQGRNEIVLPADTRQLIEAVYSDSPAWIDDLPEPLPTLLHDAQKRMLASFRSDEQQAYQRIVRTPADERLLSQPNLDLEEDDPEINPELQAITRLIDPGISVVCVHQTPHGIATEPDGSTLLDPEAFLTRELERQLLQCVVTIHHREVVTALTKLMPPDSWTASPALRYCRLAVFVDGEYHVPGTSLVLRLTRELGLEIVKA